MPFDPDAYLRTPVAEEPSAFDPDAYLKATAPAPANQYLPRSIMDTIQAVMDEN